MEDDSKEEKSGCEVGSCLNGSRMRKPVPVRINGNGEINVHNLECFPDSSKTLFT